MIKQSGDYQIEADLQNTSCIDFKVFRAVAWGGDKFDIPEYMIGTEMNDGLTPDTSLALPVITGFVRFDGCMQAYLSDPEPAFHFDSLEDITAQSAMFVAVWELAKEMIGRNWHG